MPGNCMLNSTYSLKLNVKQLDAKCTAAVHAFVMHCEGTLVYEGNIGSFYRYVANKMTNKTGTGLIKHAYATSVHDDTKKLNMRLLTSKWCQELFSSNRQIMSIHCSHTANTCYLGHINVFTLPGKLSPQTLWFPTEVLHTLLIYLAPLTSFCVHLSWTVDQKLS